MSSYASQLHEEQQAVDRAYGRLDDLRAEMWQRLDTVRAAGSHGSPTQRSERDSFATMYENRLTQLRSVEDRLVFGRLDAKNDDRHYIGRIGLSSPDHEPILTDWRAEAARPFYEATPSNHGDIVMRRHITLSFREVVGVEDEVLDVHSDQVGQASSAGTLTGEGALLASLSSRRTGKMTDIVATIQAAAELVRIFKDYGEERFSRQIARAIVARRDKEPFTTTAQLNRLVDEVVPQAHRPAGNPAKRVFQALRIEVNGELDKLASTLPQAANRLHVGGRLVVESYHSLEDKTVKSFMAQGLRVDVPAGLPVIPPDAQPFFTDLTRGAIKADEHEIAANPRSASVRLRAVEVSREIPSRWRKRFTQTAQGLNDVKIQGSASPGRAKNTARIRTRRG